MNFEARQALQERFNAMSQDMQREAMRRMDDAQTDPHLKYVRRTNEGSLLLDTLRYLGIPHESRWYALPPNKTKEEWDQVIGDLGFCLTSLATHGYSVGNILFVFSTGQPHCPDGEAHGPNNLFLFAYDMKEDKVLPRVRHDLHVTGTRMGTEEGLDAATADYKFSI